MPPVPRPPAAPPRRSHARVVAVLLLVLGCSVALVASAVPLYNAFCKAFGIARPTIAVAGQGPVIAPSAGGGRSVVVRFTSNVAAGVPVAFQPNTYSMRVRLGQPVLTAFTAQNLAPQGLDGVAVHMLYAMGGPAGTDLAPFVDLQQCFCFTQQHYPGAAKVRLPLAFTLSPNLPEGIHTITFAYTLFRALPGDPRLRSNPAAVPVEAGTGHAAAR